MIQFAERRSGARRPWLLGAGFALLGLAAWWQWRSLHEDDAVRPPRERRPDAIVQQLSALETDATGRPSRRLSAKQLRHYADEDLSELDEPHLVLYRPDGPPWFARARRGQVRAGGDQVHLIGDVHLDREGDDTGRALHLRTEAMVIWRQTGLAETDRPVTIDSDGDSITAKGMKLWYLEDNSRVSLQGRAHIRLSPQPEHRSAP